MAYRFIIAAYTFGYTKESPRWIWIAVICVFMRPTSAPLWITLGVYNLLTTNQNRLRLIMRTYVPIGLIVGSVLVALDSYHYGRLIVTPWEFFRFNVLNDIASFYGEHPWHWYLTQGLPAVLGINLVPVVCCSVAILRRPRENKVSLVLLVAAALYVAVYSFIPHKEFRFVLPLLPIFLYLAQLIIVPWSRKAKKWQLYLVAGGILLGNGIPAVYFSTVHQAGPLTAVSLLRDAATTNRSSITFLMPCHSTPLYSHLHRNITTRFLNCDPPLEKTGQTHESEAFFNNPLRWWRNEYATRQTPTLLVLFDKLKGRLENVLAGYQLLHDIPHTQFPEGEVGENILIYRKAQNSPKPPASDDIL